MTWIFVQSLNHQIVHVDDFSNRVENHLDNHSGESVLKLNFLQTRFFIKMSSLIKLFVPSDFFHAYRQIELESIFIADFIGYNHKIVWEESESFPTHYFWFYLWLEGKDEFQEVVVRAYHEVEIVSYSVIMTVPHLEFPRNETNQRVRIFAERRFWNRNELCDTQFSIGNVVYIRTDEDHRDRQGYVVIDSVEFRPVTRKGTLSAPVRPKQYETPGTVVYYQGEPNVKQVIFGLIKDDQIVTIKHE